MLRTSESLKAWLAYAAVAIFWGTTFYAIRIGVQSMPPFLMAGIRQSTAGVLIVSYFMLRKYPLPDREVWKHVSKTGFLMLLLGNGLVSWAVRYVPSGLAAIVCALTPVWMVVINSFGKQKETINWRVAAGFIICFVAQILIFRNKTGEMGEVHYAVGLFFVFVANIAWAYGSIVAKRSPIQIHPLYGAGLQMVMGGLFLTITSFSIGEWHDIYPHASAWWAIVYLVLIGSILSYGCFMYILKKLPATLVSTYAYINTLVAVLLGYALLDEALTWDMLAGVILTIAGVYTVSRNYKVT